MTSPDIPLQCKDVLGALDVARPSLRLSSDVLSASSALILAKPTGVHTVCGLAPHCGGL